MDNSKLNVFAMGMGAKSISSAASSSVSAKASSAKLQTAQSGQDFGAQLDKAQAAGTKETSSLKETVNEIKEAVKEVQKDAMGAEAGTQKTEASEAGNPETQVTEAAETAAAEAQASLQAVKLIIADTVLEVETQMEMPVAEPVMQQSSSIEALLSGKPQAVNVGLQQALSTISTHIFQQPVQAVETVPAMEQPQQLQQLQQVQQAVAAAQPMAEAGSSIEALLNTVQAKNAEADQAMLNMLYGKSFAGNQAEQVNSVQAVFPAEEAAPAVAIQSFSATINNPQNNEAEDNVALNTMASMLDGAEVVVENRGTSNQNLQQNGQQKQQEIFESYNVVNAQAQAEAQPVQLSQEVVFDAAPARAAETSVNPAPAIQQPFGMPEAAEESVEVQQPQQNLEAYDIPKQIVEQARLIRANESTEMIIKLNPAHLGDLTLKVSVNTNSGVTAVFHSDNSQVRGLLETSMLQLKQELNEQGIKVDSIEVSAGLPDGQMPQDMRQGYYAQQGGGQQQNTSTSEDLNAYEEGAQDPVTGEPVNQSTEVIRDDQGNVISDGVDYKV
ncbi:MAG: flagellar hook-length control protein FliK [Selenomonadaceae bacterium]|nr:flagellar hook-length control protein FliK [Selenomonadaceae bacterium]